MDMRSLSRTIAWRREMALRHEQTARRLRPALNVGRCPACEHGGHAPFVAIYGFRYHECDRCGHLFLQDPPSAADIEQLYQGQTPQAAVYVGEELFKRRVEQIARPKLEFCREWIEPQGAWFDVGCGTGELLSVAAEAGWVPRGCETDPEHVRFARERGLNVSEGYVRELPLELASDVQVISILNVLEHVPAPREWLGTLTKNLRRGGYVVVEVPRHPSLSSFSNLTHPELASRHIYPPDHLHIFTEAALEHVLGAAGFQARAVWVFGQDFQELLYACAARAELAESAFFHQLLDASEVVQAAIDSQNLSDVLLVVAEKV